ncbi:diguanylate cyclase domain-containing protein [Methylotenera sp. L2L1]|uniref:diguanylate cyclase domain-containing protein n=1 Tax=Methylotenera sp. L2L1 TaxID=1502770 RepID=UPI001F1640D9|nr:sensor domain-containing diguanylate cyclase [Methylotenera sp. L2L1]
MHASLMFSQEKPYTMVFVEKNAEVLYSREFKFGSRLYRLETTPTALYYQHHRGWQSWNMLAIGLFGTGLMGALLLMGTGYTVRIENLVKQKAEELKESFSRFQEITSTLGQGIYVMDTNGMITFTNPKAQDLLGRSEHELLGQNAYLLFHNKHLDETPYPESACHIRNVMYSKQSYKSAEEIFWHKNGMPIYIAVSAVPLFRSNEVVGAVVVFDDISERKKIEHALRASEKSFREIIEYAPIGMAIVSLEGRFTIVNQTLCNIVGYTSDELTRLTFQEITYAEDLSIDLEYVQQLVDGKIDTYQMEKRYIRKDKKIVWVQLSASVFRDEEQSPQYFIAQIENITDRKIRDNEIKQDAYFDTLTTLPNRKMLMDRLQHALAQAERYQRTVALFFLDLDHFKAINDTLGHDVGDLILKESALRLLSCVRVNDTVARLGGDEFVIVLSEISGIKAAEVVAEKILNKFKAPIDVHGQEVFISTSIGVAIRSGDMKINVKQLMKNADIAMYQSKAAGRNRCYFYDTM